jgi:hypothetical protein
MRRRGALKLQSLRCGHAAFARTFFPLLGKRVLPHTHTHTHTHTHAHTHTHTHTHLLPVTPFRYDNTGAEFNFLNCGACGTEKPAVSPDAIMVGSTEISSAANIPLRKELVQADGPNMEERAKRITQWSASVAYAAPVQPTGPNAASDGRGAQQRGGGGAARGAPGENNAVGRGAARSTTAAEIISGLASVGEYHYVDSADESNGGETLERAPLAGRAGSGGGEPVRQDVATRSSSIGDHSRGIPISRVRHHTAAVAAAGEPRIAAARARMEAIRPLEGSTSPPGVRASVGGAASANAAQMDAMRALSASPPARQASGLAAADTPVAAASASAAAVPLSSSPKPHMRGRTPPDNRPSMSTPRAQPLAMSPMLAAASEASFPFKHLAGTQPPAAAESSPRRSSRASGSNASTPSHVASKAFNAASNAAFAKAMPARRGVLHVTLTLPSGESEMGFTVRCGSVQSGRGGQHIISQVRCKSTLFAS